MYRFTEKELKELKKNALALRKKFIEADRVEDADPQIKAIKAVLNKQFRNPSQWGGTVANDLAALASAITGKKIEVKSKNSNGNNFLIEGLIFVLTKRTQSNHIYPLDVPVMVLADNNYCFLNMEGNKVSGYSFCEAEARIADEKEIEAFFKAFEPPREEGSIQVRDILRRV